MGDRTSLTLYEGMGYFMENVFINVKNRSHVITAEVEIPEGGGEGVIIAQGGKATYIHNWLGKEFYTVTSPEAIPAGKATIRYELAYEGGKEFGKGGTGTIFVNDKKVAEGKIDQTVPFIFSADETTDVGVDHHTPVSDQYPQRGNEFTGKIEKVTIDLK
jgi:hypothetical protein